MTSETKTIRIYINKVEYRIDNPKQTGKSLKKLAGIPACDVLFLEGPCEDQVIKDDAEVVLRECDRLHSQPPANYGFTRNLVAEAGIDEDCVSVYPQPGGWARRWPRPGWLARDRRGGRAVVHGLLWILDKLGTHDVRGQLVSGALHHAVATPPRLAEDLGVVVRAEPAAAARQSRSDPYSGSSAASPAPR